jgi:hypothetical protein
MSEIEDIIISYAKTRNEDVLSQICPNLKHDSISNINLKEIWNSDLDRDLYVDKIHLIVYLYNACAYCAIELGLYKVSYIIYYRGLISQEKCEKKIIKLIKA